jgi:hypothetical protein
MPAPLRDEPTFLNVGEGAEKRQIAVLCREGRGKNNTTTIIGQM